MNIKNVKIFSEKGDISASIHYPKVIGHKLIILCPGYLDSKDYSGLVSHAEMFAAQGFTAVRFDPIGVWESEGSTKDYTVTQCLEDLDTVYKYMMFFYDYTHLIVGGHSRGGMISILYAARHPKNVSAVLPIMPSTNKLFSSAKEKKASTLWKENGVKASLRDFPHSRSKTKTFFIPYSYVQDRMKYDVTREVGRVTVPIFFIAGANDITCPPYIVEELVHSAGRSRCCYTVVPGVDHNYRLDVQQITIVNEYIFQMMSRYYA